MPFQATGDHHETNYFRMKIGPLQRQLQTGEYGFFKYSLMFESDFVQISKHGGPVMITNEEEIVAIGISFSSPVSLIPDVLLVGRRIYLSEYPTLRLGTKIYPRRKMKYELNRLFPLSLVKISVHDVEKQQLKFKLASGRTFYLQLFPESHRREYLFDSWTKIIQILWPPSGIKSQMNKKAIEANRNRSSPPPRTKAPSPKHPVKSRTAWSELFFPKKEKRKTSSRAEQGAELVRALSSQARIFIKESYSRRSRSGLRGATQKASKLLSLIRSRSWVGPRKSSQRFRSQSKEEKQ